MRYSTSQLFSVFTAAGLLLGLGVVLERVFGSQAVYVGLLSCLMVVSAGIALVLLSGGAATVGAKLAEWCQRCIDFLLRSPKDDDRR